MDDVAGGRGTSGGHTPRDSDTGSSGWVLSGSNVRGRISSYREDRITIIRCNFLVLFADS